MGGGTSSTTSSTQSSNPQVTSTLNQLLGGVQEAYKAGPTYVAPGATTVAGQGAALSAAANPQFGAGLSAAYGNTDRLLQSGGLTSGQQSDLGQAQSLADQYGRMALDPGSTQAGQNLKNDVLTSTNAAFNNSGLFGTDTNQTAAARGLTQGLGALQQGYMSGQGAALGNAFDMGQQGVSNSSSLAQLLPALYQTGQLPAGTQTAIGSAQDTSAQNAANRNLTLLSQLSGVLSGNAATAGTTTTNTVPTPNTLQSLLGLGLTLL